MKKFMSKLPKDFVLRVCPHCDIKLVVRRSSPDYKNCGVCTKPLPKEKKSASH